MPSSKRKQSFTNNLILTHVLAAVVAAVLVVALIFGVLPLFGSDVVENIQNRPRSQAPDSSIEVTTHFFIPPLDLRGYDLDHYEVEEWFLRRINYHRVNYGIHPYTIYAPASVTSIEHSLDMRENNFSGNNASDGRTHQQRHDRWLGQARTRVTSASTRSRRIDGPLTREQVNEIVDSIVAAETAEAFILNPTYYYIGIGFSIQRNGRGRLSITMVGKEGLRAAHRARTPEERDQHREEYLARVREERGWNPEG